MAKEKYERKKLDKIDLNLFFADAKDRPACCQCEHVADCMSRVRDWNKLMDAYPNVCATCLGSGLVSYMENLAPHGEGTWNCEMTDACDCWTYDDTGRCPVCAGELTEDDLERDELDNPTWYCISPFCNWNSNKEEPVIKMEKPYCIVHAKVYDYW